MLQVDDLTPDIREAWAEALEVDRVEPREDYTDRLFGVGGPVLNRTTVILLRPVGPDYSSAFRGWVTLRRADRFAAMSERPRGYRVVYAMVGVAPDGRVWWSALYDEAELPIDEAEDMNGGRFFRLRPEQAARALIEDFDHLNLQLPWVDPVVLASEVTGVPLVRAIEAPLGALVSMRGKIVKHNAGGSVTVDFGTVKWAIVGVTPVHVETAG